MPSSIPFRTSWGWPSQVKGRFDPVTGVKLAAKFDTAVEALFAEATPDTAPSDPIEKQHHLRALALARLLDGATSGKPGRGEFVVVIDADAPAVVRSPAARWPTTAANSITSSGGVTADAPTWTT
jgi:hypothetical protein